MDKINETNNTNKLISVPKKVILTVNFAAGNRQNLGRGNEDQISLNILLCS